MNINFRSLVGITPTPLPLHTYMKWLQHGAISLVREEGKAMANIWFTPPILDCLPAEISSDVLVSRTHNLQSNLLRCIKSLLLSLSYTSKWLIEFLVLSKLTWLLFLKLYYLSEVYHIKWLKLRWLHTHIKYLPTHHFKMDNTKEFADNITSSIKKSLEQIFQVNAKGCHVECYPAISSLQAM